MKSNLTATSLIAAASLLHIAIAFADTPNLEGPHGHARSVSGKVTMFRVQEKGIEVVTGGEKVDAEIVVQIDSQPKMLFSLPLHAQDPSRSEMVETLRQAYLKDKPVTIEHKLAMDKPIAQINWVQFGALDLK